VGFVDEVDLEYYGRIWVENEVATRCKYTSLTDLMEYNLGNIKYIKLMNELGVP